MKQGPRSGIFSVYILRNVDLYFINLFMPLILCSVFFSLSNKNLVICLSLIIFHSKLYKIRDACLCELCNRTPRGLEEGFATWSTNLWANRTETYMNIFDFVHLHHLHLYCCSSPSRQIGTCCSNGHKVPVWVSFSVYSDIPLNGSFSLYV